MDRHTDRTAPVAADRTALVADLTSLLRVPSVGGTAAESAAQDWVADWLGHNGFEVDVWDLDLTDHAEDPDFPGMEVPRDRVRGVVGRLPGSGDGPSLLFNGHVDVVPPGDPSAWRVTGPFAPAVHDDRVYGRGACDMKAGVVAMLHAAAAVARRDVRPRGDLLVATVVGEEDGGVGTHALLRRGWRADACVITEPTGLDIVTANGGALTFRLTVTGAAAHASQRTRGVSAVERFLPVFAALRDLEAERNRDVDPLMAGWDLAYPVEIGVVRAGDWASTVPDLLTAEGRFGVALDETTDTARRVLEDTVAAVNAADPWLRDHPVVVEWWGGRFASTRLPADDAGLLDRLADCHRATTGRPARVWGAPYGSDARLLTAAGIPTVQYGPGDIASAHAADESVPIDQLVTATDTLTALALRHCGVD